MLREDWLAPLPPEARFARMCPPTPSLTRGAGVAKVPQVQLGGDIRSLHPAVGDALHLGQPPPEAAQRGWGQIVGKAPDGVGGGQLGATTAMGMQQWLAQPRGAQLMSILQRSTCVAFLAMPAGLLTSPAG